MPKNSTTVVMQENIKKEKNDCISFIKIPKEGANCRFAGEDVAKGDRILHSGQKIKSTNLNLLAALGKSHIKVKKKIESWIFHKW